MDTVEVTEYTCSYWKCDKPAVYLPQIDNGHHNDFCSEECAEKDYEQYLAERDYCWPDAD